MPEIYWVLIFVICPISFLNPVYFQKPDNYRGITLLNTLGKLFTRVVNNRLESWAEECGVYIEAQYGFRKGRGTVDCIFVLSQLVNNFVNSGKKLRFFVDFP